MDITNTILVVIDPTKDKQPALGQALILAKKLKMNLELLICDYVSHIVENKHFLKLEELNHHIDSYLKHHDQHLEELAEPLREQGFVVNCITVWDYPLHEAIIRRALKVKPFMIVKNTHYHNKFSRSVFRNTDWSLIRTCKIPLLFVKPNKLWHTPTVTCAVNPVHEDHSPNEHDKDIVQLGKLIAHKMKGSLQIYHSYYSILNLPSSAYSWSGQFGIIFTEEADQQIRQSRLQALYRLADEFSIEHNRITMEDGETRYCLPKFICESKTDLLIIGATSKSRFEQVFIGGTTEDLLDEVDCDILVLHPADFVSPMKNTHPTLIK